MKWFLLGFLSILISYVSYEAYFKYEINDLQVKRIEQNLQLNFRENQNHFQELVDYSKTVGIIENLEFFDNKLIHFQVYDSLENDINRGVNLLPIGDNTDVHTRNISFSDTNSIIIVTDAGKLVLENWAIDFRGEMTDTIAKQLLSYHNVSQEELIEIQQRMEKVNCNAFDKNENLLTLRYKGHWGESFNYKIPLRDSVSLESWNQLSDNYYWEHYEEGIFCGWTDW